MDGTSSRSPPGRADELSRVLKGEEGEKLRASIRRLVVRQETVEDVMQQACEQFLRYPREILEPKAMLGKIARNLALTHLKWKRRHPEMALTAMQAEPVAGSWSLEKVEASEQFEQRFSVVLESLSEVELQLLDRHYWQGMNVKEIAAQEGTSDKAIKKRVSRLLRRFREAMLGDDIRRADVE